METKICKVCGRELPLDDFNVNRRYQDGRHPICKNCYNATLREKRAMQKKLLGRAGLEAYSPRDLMEELYKRGYKGVLEYTEVHKIDNSNF